MLIKLLTIINLLIFLLQPISGFGRSIKRQTIRILQNRNNYPADKVLYEKPITITNFRCDRSAGGIHDFYSEGDYWWPDPENPDGPYIQRDGMSNPGNFAGASKSDDPSKPDHWFNGFSI